MQGRTYHGANTLSRMFRTVRQKISCGPQQFLHTFFPFISVI